MSGAAAEATEGSPTHAACRPRAAPSDLLAEHPVPPEPFNEGVPLLDGSLDKHDRL